MGEIVSSPAFRLNYKGKNITSDISKYLISMTFSDKVESGSDEVSITLEDSDQLWQNSWYPSKGDKMELFIGYDESKTKAGTFTVDEVDFDGPPDVVTIKALSTPITKKLRTKRSAAYENVTVKQLAEKIAAKNGLTLDGLIYLAPNKDLLHERVSQNRETDLQFLMRICDQYGIIFSVRDTKLIITDQQKAEQRSHVTTIDKSSVSRWRFTDKTIKTYSSAQVSFRNPDTNEVVQGAYSFEDSLDGAPSFIKDNVPGEVFSELDSELDQIQLKMRAENQQQAEVMAQAALYRANTNGKEGSITVYGNPLLLAGNNIELTGFGKLSGKYHIKESTHRFSKSGGYTTDVSIKRVAAVPAVKRKTDNVNPAASTGAPRNRTIAEIIKAYGT